MKHLLSLLLVAAVSTVQASPDDFPWFDLLHSHCQVTVIVPNQLCAVVYSDLISVMDKFNAGGDPTGGQYLYKERQAINYIWMIHNSKRGWYSDVMFEPIQLGNDCQIRGRSRTQSTFHSAGTENYCDLWNVYNSLDNYISLTVSSCSSTPVDPLKTCSGQ